MTKVTIPQENIIILSVYADNNKTFKQKQKLTELKRDICKSSITVGDFNRPLSATYRTSGEEKKAFKVNRTLEFYQSM